ncbi:MAG: TRAP transporter large permease subunit, partial [Gammaproteobacteria bacterium]
AGAFVMASYTQIDYGTIVAVAFVPALLYFLSLAFYVRFEAFKQGIEKPEGKGPNLWKLTYKEGLSFVVPVLLLIGMLVYGFTPVYAGAFAILAVIITSWFTPIKMGPRAIADAFAMGARNMVMTAILLCAVGLIINVIATAGIGNTFSLMIADWAGGSLFIAILLVGLASLLLGMGLPVTAAYIVLATLSAPALLNLMANIEMAYTLSAGPLAEDIKPILMLGAPQLMEQLMDPTFQLDYAAAVSLLEGMPNETVLLLQPKLVDADRLTLLLLSAHMIIFWLSQDSNVTPPVCLCSFTAATIAKTPPMATGFASWKIAKSLYIIPLLFAYTPLLTGSTEEVLEIGLYTALGLYAFTSAVQGWHMVKLNIFTRLIMVGCTFALLWPLDRVYHIAGAVVLVTLAVYLSQQYKKQPRTNSVAAEAG